MINSPNNPDRLDDRPATSSRRSSRIAAGTASGSSPTTSTSGFTTAAAHCAPSFLDLADARRTRDQHQQLLEGVADDRVAARLDRRADGADARARQADRIQHVVLAGVRAARGRRRRSPMARRRSRHTLARYATRANSWSASSRECRASTSRRRPARCTRSSASTGVTDSLAFCKRLVREARLGLAPGSAFGPEGEGFVRWCFASSPERLADGVARLERFLADQAASGQGTRVPTPRGRSRPGVPGRSP